MKRILLIAITMLLGVSPAYAQTCGSALMPAFTAAQATNLCNRGFDQVTPGRVTVGAGTAAAPSMSFSAETNLGIFRNTGGLPAMSFATAGTGRAHITNNGVTVGNQPFSSSSPVGGIINATDSGGTNIAGANLTIRGGASTGNAAGGALILQTSAAGVSGVSQNAAAERMRVKTNGQVRFVPLAADPSGAEAGDVYYNSGTSKLRVYNGSIWVDLH